MSACGGDDEPDPEPIDCSTLALTATAKGTTITAVATGGEAPYKFRLDEGTAQSSGTFTVEEFGSYEVTVTDANECEKKTTVQVVDPCANFSVSATASAYDLTIAINDGTPPFSYSYSNGNEEITADDINERSFTVELAVAEETTITITDANDCTAEATVEAEDIASFTDERDGQTYELVKIGDQIWFAEHFNYNTNTADSTSSWYYNDDSATYAAEYGRLYTWHVAQEIAPEGWSLPSEADFQAFFDIYGNEVNASKALRVGGVSDFDFDLGGLLDGEFYDIDVAGFLWSSSISVDFPEDGIYVGIIPNNDRFDISGADKINGMSVRFIKD
ncbi:hypothetical protein GCM10011506_25430 [Marivirga lumbricoides]|uniref:Fibrobacter succinogenes major paralogous domain-containing protein n=2 Tax=Marivirga lumbricoides TaxID=1046115 RepID=A0ABQ1MGS0_9BACT|nr:hypothetical protein GCM10011506_25430 [Marivirga lumbricoides]